MQVNLKQKCFPGNLKNKFFYPTWQIFIRYKYTTCFNNGRLSLQSIVSAFFRFGFCLLLGLSVFWLVGLFVSGLVCQLGVVFVSGFVCLWVGKYVTSPFNSRGGVNVGLFN